MPFPPVLPFGTSLHVLHPSQEWLFISWQTYSHSYRRPVILGNSNSCLCLYSINYHYRLILRVTMFWTYHRYAATCIFSQALFDCRLNFILKVIACCDSNPIWVNPASPRDVACLPSSKLISGGVLFCLFSIWGSFLVDVALGLPQTTRWSSTLYQNPLSPWSSQVTSCFLDAAFLEGVPLLHSRCCL